MANTIRIKRRWTGTTDAPATLKSGEVAYNGVNDVLYIGFGDDGSGNATSVKAMGGFGAFLGLTTDQVVGGIKTFSSSPVVPTLASTDNSTKAASTAFVKSVVSAASIPDGDKGDVTVASSGAVWTIDADAVTNAKLANMATSTLKGRVTAGTGDPEDLTVGQVRTLLSLNNVDNTSDANKPVSTAQQAALDTKAPLSSPALTGTPTAPTATAGTNTTQLATTAFVASAIAALIGSAPGALDTLNELAAALGNDPNFATTITNGLAGKLTAASNLSDLGNVGTARSNLGLGTMATQNAVAVAITGGTIDGVTLDGGTY
jgi:hypothetical protein